MIVMDRENLQSAEEIIRVASNYNDMVNIHWDSINKGIGSKDRLIALLASDNIFINKKRYGKNILEIYRNKEESTLVSDKLLSFNALVTLMYWLRLHNYSVNSAASIEMYDGKVDIGAAILEVDRGNLRVVVKNCHRQLVDVSIEINELMLKRKHTVLRFDVTKNVEDLDLILLVLLGRESTVIYSFRLKGNFGAISILEFENLACAVKGNKVIILYAEKDYKCKLNRFLDNCKNEIGLENLSSIPML